MEKMNLEALNDMSDHVRAIVIKKLDELHETVKDDETQADLAIGLEQVLQALGAEGYEFS